MHNHTHLSSTFAKHICHCSIFCLADGWYENSHVSQILTPSPLLKQTLLNSNALAVFDFGRSFIYHALARNAAAPLSGRAAPAIDTDFVTQVRVEILACLFVRPQTPVDGLVADRNDVFKFHPVADFLGTRPRKLFSVKSSD